MFLRAKRRQKQKINCHCDGVTCLSLHRKERPKQSDIQCCKDEIASLTAFARNDTGWNIKSITSFVLSNLIFIFCVATLFVHCSLTFMLDAQEEKKGKNELIWGFTLNPMIRNTSIGGKGTADMRELFQIAADEFKKLYGYTLTLKIYPSPKFLFKAIQDNTVDFPAGYLAIYLHAKNLGLPMKPLLTVSTTGIKGEKRCIWVHKDSGIKNIKQLQGKRFVHDFPPFMSKKDALPPKESYIYWVMLKKTLLKNGIDKPLTAFFKEFWVLPTAGESIAYSVLLKKFDAFYSANAVMKSLMNYDKGFSAIIPLSCLDVPVNPPLAYRKDLNPEIVRTMKNYFLSPPKGSALDKIVKKEFKGIKIYAVDEKDYAIYFQWLKEAEQKGWFKEFDEIMKNTPKPGEKKKDIGGLDVLKTTK